MMLRKIAVWVLLGPMLLNGLWMVCNSSSDDASDASAKAEQECIRICLMKHADVLGPICFMLPSSKISITVVDFGSVVLPAVVRLHTSIIEESLVVEPTTLQASPAPQIHTPPPRG